MWNEFDHLVEWLLGSWQTASPRDYMSLIASVVIAAWFWGRMHRR